MAYDITKSPGEWVTRQARRRERRVWLVIASALAVLLLVAWVSISKRNSVAALILLGLMYALYRLAGREGVAAISWIRGARSERAVGETLAGLGGAYVVMHDIEQPGEGNIDHLVCGPTGVYLVETKHRRYREDDLRKAKRQAAKLHDELRVWVTPVICIDLRRGSKPYRHHGVWVVSREWVVEWIRAQTNSVVEFARLAAFADTL